MDKSFSASNTKIQTAPNVLVHVNGASFTPPTEGQPGIAEIGLNPSSPDFQLAVIDGQHRINGAFFALMLRRRTVSTAAYEVPAEIFLDLDPPGAEPKRQAQIFIDVNLYQKKVDRSLVADLFPTTREQGPLDNKERAQDIGRKLMLEVGPLVGMIQIPGIKYGVKDVVTLATLNSAIEGALPSLDATDITNLEAQTAFIAQILQCWLDATGRDEGGSKAVDSQSVVYQGRVLVSMLDLVPAILSHLQSLRLPFVSAKARTELVDWFRGIIDRAGLLLDGKFIEKDEFKQLGFLGSGGIGRFRNRLWAATSRKRRLGSIDDEAVSELATEAKDKTNQELTRA